MPNRLAGAASTYLLQHADNPVDWWPWGDEAFDEARRRDVPVLLSVGYASCHWCHVMAHESFEDPEIAGQINAAFVPIKVDREERPDVDAAYMAATQALTGQGGWPMTTFLTHERQTFYAGTYFPPVPHHGLPSFRQVLAAVGRGWREDRDQIQAAAAHIAAALSGGHPAGAELGREDAQGLPQAPDPVALDTAAAALISDIDPVRGGFRGAPKFPPAMVCEFLLRHHESTGSTQALRAVTVTLEAMARGGIHDQIGGGFARYSVDSHWHVPHFEKMVDDNALLLELYAHHARLTGSGLSQLVAQRTGDFLLREMCTPDGAFAASLDADAPGGEGASYLWTLEQLYDLLGPDDGPWAAELLTVGAVDQPVDLTGSILRLPLDPPDPERFERIRLSMLAARDRRPQPVRDDIVVLASNGLAIGALAEAGATLHRADWIAAAARAADFLLHRHLLDGNWSHSSRAGVLGPAPAVLADLGDLAGGLLALYQATGDLQWRDLASDLLATARTRYADGPGSEPGPESGPVGPVRPDGDWWTGRWRDVLPGGGVPERPGDPADGVVPSGASAIADALLTSAALSGSTEHRVAAERTLAAGAALMTGVPRAAGWQLAVAQAAAAGPLQIAVVGDAGPERAELAAAARRHAPGGSVIEVGLPDSPGRELLADRPEIDGGPAAYVCRGFVCDRPVTDVEELIDLLGRRPGDGTQASGARPEVRPSIDPETREQNPLAGQL